MFKNSYYDSKNVSIFSEQYAIFKVFFIMMELGIYSRIIKQLTSYISVKWKGGNYRMGKKAWFRTISRRDVTSKGPIEFLRTVHSFVYLNFTLYSFIDLELTKIIMKHMN